MIWGQVENVLPLFLDLNASKAVVFGGGEVGLRKAAYLAKEAKVVVVSNEFCKGLIDSGIELVKQDALKELPKWVEWADLVVAATNDHHTNETIIQECAKHSKPCNCADGVSTFLIPSTVEKDGYSIAISTLGRSPAMAKFLRIWLEQHLTPEFERMVALQEELREIAKKKISSQRERESFLWDVLQDEMIWRAVNDDDLSKARSLAEGRMVKYVGNAAECSHHP